MVQLQLRLNAAAIIQRPDGKILICERNDVPGAWQFPQGGVDAGESAEETVQREVWEEIGVSQEAYTVARSDGPFVYHFPNREMKRGYHGQSQTCFLLKTHADELPVMLDTETPEFSSARWIYPEEFSLEWVPEFKQEVFQEIFRRFFSVELKNAKNS